MGVGVGVRAVAIEFWRPDRSLGGFATLTVGERAASYWAGVVGPGRTLVLVNDDDVAPPRRPDSWEIRAEGLWADHNCETAGEHWSFGLEAFGTGFDDPAAAVVEHAWGDRVPLGYDLEWDSGTVYGEILLGAERIEFEGEGTLATDADAVAVEPGLERWRRWVAWATTTSP